jgi:exopolysaccharide production protein ExoQ
MTASISPSTDHSRFLNRANWLLLGILFMMIAAFFTWSENIIITRIIKVIGRMGMLGASWLVYRMILQYGAVDALKGDNLLAIGFYLMYLGLGFASFVWTSDIGVSALQWFMTSQTLIFCYYFIKSLYTLDAYFPGHSIRLYNLLGNSIFVIIMIFVVGMYVDPDTFFRLTHGGTEARLGGFIMNPNELGMLAGVGVAGFLFDIKRNHQTKFTTLKILILFYALFLTGSRSSLIGAVLIVLFYIQQSGSTRLKLAVVGGMVLVLPFLVQTVILKDGDADRVEEVLSMTGRLPFWKGLISEGLPREPLLGFGFMRIDYNDYFQARNSYPGKMTHNTFIQVLMNLGFVGLTIMILQLIYTYRAVFRQETEKKNMLIGISIPILINSITEFGIFGESNFGILFYQLIIIYLSFKPNPYITDAQKLHLRIRRPDLKIIQ